MKKILKKIYFKILDNEDRIRSMEQEVYPASKKGDYESARNSGVIDSLKYVNNFLDSLVDEILLEIKES